MQVRVLLFASLRERAGLPELSLDIPGSADVAGVKRALEARFPNLLGSGAAAVAVNGRYVRDESARVSAGDEIAFLPPVSGG